MPFAGWSPLGIAAFVAIAAGIVLLVAYAVRRGLVHRELEGIEGTDTTDAVAPTSIAGSTRQYRSLGALGALLLVAGLALGIMSAVGSWGTDQTTGGPGIAPGDCAQSWDGCAKATPLP